MSEYWKSFSSYQAAGGEHHEICWERNRHDLKAQYVCICPTDKPTDDELENMGPEIPSLGGCNLHSGEGGMLQKPTKPDLIAAAEKALMDFDAHRTIPKHGCCGMAEQTERDLQAAVAAEKERREAVKVLVKWAQTAASIVPTQTIQRELFAALARLQQLS